MTIAENEHNAFKQMTSDLEFRLNVTMNQPMFKSSLLEMYIFEESKPQKRFLKSMLNQVENNEIYLLPVRSFVMFMTKDFQSTIAFAMRKPNKKHKRCFNVPWMIEIDAVHSDKKGNGSYLMNIVLKISDDAKVPTSLWSETSKNTNYFKKYGFKPYGKRGDNNEELLIRKQIPTA